MAQVRRKRWAGPVMVAILLIGCSGSSRSSTTGASTGGEGPPSGGTIVIGPDGSSSVVEVPPADGTTGGSTTADSGTASSSGPQLDPAGPPCSFAPAYLSPAQSNTVVVEVRAQSGTGPQQASIDHLTAVLGNVTGKSVTVTGGASIGGGAKSWTADELRAAGTAGGAQGNGRA